MRKKTLVSCAAAAALLSATADAQLFSAGTSGVAFDEIDRVMPGTVTAAPGNFAQDLVGIRSGAIPALPPDPAQAPAQAAPAPSARPRGSSIFDAINRAGGVLGGASTVINAGGAVSTMLGVADVGARLAPVANVLGLTGTQNWGGLVQQYVLPQTSPSMVPLVSGYLAAQNAYRSSFPRAQSAAPDQQQPQPPPQAQPQPQAQAPNPAGAGTLRHYSIYRNGWMRIDDPASRTATITKPDEGMTYVLDAATKTYVVQPMAASPPAAGAAPAGSAQAELSETTRTLGTGQVEGVTAAGYRTEATVKIAGASGSCKDGTYASRRITYFAAFDDRSPSSQTPGSTATGGCAPVTSVKHAGVTIPAGKLLVYNWNALDRDDGTGRQTITMVEERANFTPLTTEDAGLFQIPADYKRR